MVGLLGFLPLRHVLTPPKTEKQEVPCRQSRVELALKQRSSDFGRRFAALASYSLTFAMCGLEDFVIGFYWDYMVL